MAIRTSYVEVGGATSYLATPQGTSKAGLVLIPTVTGIDRFARDYSDRLAAIGYATLAWNPYAGTKDGLAAEESRARVTTLKDRDCLGHLSACVDYIQGELRLQEVGAIGFCFGGRFALLMAARDRRVKACVAAYPSVFTPKVAYHDEDAVALAPDIACPVLLLYPGQDKVTSTEVFRALEAGLHRRTAETAILLYPEADHGFMHRPSAANDAATRSARPQINGFLDAHLGQ